MQELERILETARDAGATSAFCILVRLPWEISPLFRQWLDHHYPDRAARVMARIREMRGGRDNDSHFGSRMVGQGVWGALLSQRFHKTTKRLGYVEQRAPLDHSRFRRPRAPSRALGTTAGDNSQPIAAAASAQARPVTEPPQATLFD